MVPTSPNYFLGRIYDPKTKVATSEQVLLDPANLTTHAVVTGMTGSGKTGLCIGLLEEAALHGTPAIIIDPKGDLTNLLLHFPGQNPSDFEPWIDPETARRDGKSVTQMAEETAAKWKKGLADWGLGEDQLKALGDSADFAIYTPGSSSGIPVNILSSFQAPELDWESNSEILRERISSTITALLGLIGISGIDPLRSREHILLSNLLETAWMNKQNLTLTDLILQVQNPPMDRLGAFPMDSFFPERDRFDLALLLNNFLASPSFQVWQQGQSLDIGAVLKSTSGKPRHSVFYIAHLSEMNACSLSHCYLLLLRAGCAVSAAQATCARSFILMKSWATCPLLPILPQRPLCCACSNRRALLALGWCLPPRTRWM